MIASDAAGLVERAVHVVDALGAGALVEVVYVLGAEVETVWSEDALDFCEGFVGGVGLGSESVAAALEVEAPDKFGIGFPGFGGGYFFDAVAVPEASAAAEGGEAAFGRDAGSGEDEEAVLKGEVHVE
jgi:hypothetical protein